MAKKFVRGVTGVDDIEKFDKTLTNVNDILSDGQNTYVHTKKGKVESYYNLTDNVKTIQSSGGTITVEKDENGTVNLKTNPQKVLEHDNLIAGSYLIKTSSGDKTSLKVSDDFVGIVNGKQNKLSAGDGLLMVGDTITLKTLTSYRENLNDLTYTCIAKPFPEATNMPVGDIGHGILIVLRLVDVVIQKYHPLSGDKVYIRRGSGIPNSPQWTNWKLLS